MRVGVIGLGSMGKRRIRLIQKYNKAIQILGVDTNEERRLACNQELNIDTYNNLNDLFTKQRINCVFICTSPLSHSEIITKCLKQGIHVFSELNLVPDGYNENISLANEKKLVLFMSSTFLYRDEIKKIKSAVQEANGLLNYTYHVGQYLPDWHPWENYKDFFVKDKRSNGCREIFAIELPWLIDVFGDIVNFQVVKNKITDLNIDYNDNYLVIVQHKTGHKGTFAVDIVSRKAVRNLEIFGEQLFLHWDGSPKGLKIYDFLEKKDIEIDVYEQVDQLENYSKFVVENAYFNEIVSFFDAVFKQKAPLYSFEKDKKVLEMIDRIEA